MLIYSDILIKPCYRFRYSKLMMIVFAVPNLEAIFTCSAVQVNIALRSTTVGINPEFFLFPGIANFTVFLLFSVDGNMNCFKCGRLLWWRFVFRWFSVLIKSDKIPHKFLSKVKQ